MADKKIKPTISRWSTAAAIFGGMCNLLCWIFVNYQFYYLKHSQPIWNYTFVFSEVISLAPLLVLFFHRHFVPITFIYAPALFLILIGRAYYLVQYYWFGIGALFYKIDMPGLLLVLLGAISMAVVLARVAIRFIAFICRTPKHSGPVS